MVPPGHRGLQALRRLLVAPVAPEVLVEIQDLDLVVCLEEAVLEEPVAVEGEGHTRAREPQGVLVSLVRVETVEALAVQAPVEQGQPVQAVRAEEQPLGRRVFLLCFLAPVAVVARVALAVAVVVSLVSVVPEEPEEPEDLAVRAAASYLLRQRRHFLIPERSARMVLTVRPVRMALTEQDLNRGEIGVVEEAELVALAVAEELVVRYISTRGQSLPALLPQQAAAARQLSGTEETEEMQTVLRQLLMAAAVAVLAQRAAVAALIQSLGGTARQVPLLLLVLVEAGATAASAVIRTRGLAVQQLRLLIKT